MDHGEHMQSVLKKDWTILASDCDAGGKLGVVQTFDIFMDLAAEHAETLDNGIHAMMARGLYWTAVKTRSRFLRRPELMERIEISTWPEAPGRLRNDRHYLFTQGDEVLVTGKTEWTVVDFKNGGLHSPRELIYPEALEFSAERADGDPFHRFRDGAPWEAFGEYTVRSTDIDLGGHMNNVAYVRMLAGRFTVAEWAALPLREAEMHYRASCYEGDVLALQKRTAEDGATELRALSGKEQIFLARLR